MGALARFYLCDIFSYQKTGKSVITELLLFNYSRLIIGHAGDILFVKLLPCLFYLWWFLYLDYSLDWTLMYQK